MNNPYVEYLLKKRREFPKQDYDLSRNSVENVKMALKPSNSFAASLILTK